MVTIALAAATTLITGFLLGAIRARPELRRIRAELAAARRLAEHDPLTGLPNRAGARRHLDLQVAAGTAQIAVLIDLDGFKAVNDTWGHQIGDAQLAAVADRLAAACSLIGALASRLGGDEFLLLLRPADLPTVLGQVTAILAGLGKPMTLRTRDAVTVILSPGASAGIALPETGSAWADLLRHADIALYRAKARPGRAVLYTCGMQQPALPGLSTQSGSLRFCTRVPHPPSRATPARRPPVHVALK